MNRNKKLTMQQIADDLNLSRMTISHILNGNPRGIYIAAKTAQRVKDYVKKVGFHQDIGALAMRGKYSKDIGIAVSASNYRIHEIIHQSILNHLSINKIPHMLFSVEVTALNELVQQIKLFGIKRLFLVATFFGSAARFKSFITDLAKFCPETKCYVYDSLQPLLHSIDFVSLGHVVSCVDRSARLKLIQHELQKYNYQKLIIIDGFRDVENLVTTCKDINIEYKIVKHDYGNVIIKNAIIKEKAYIEYGKCLAKKLSKMDFKKYKTAFYVHDDLMSMGIIKQLESQGLKLVKDYGLISWDNLPVSEYIYGGITSYGLPHEEMLKHIFLWLDNKITKPEIKKFDVVRNSEKSI